MSEQSNRMHESLEAYVAERQTWLADAVEIAGENRDTDPLAVFPEPPEVRREAPDPGWTGEQEAALREVAGRFGVGGEVDVPSGAQIELLEGGLAWKIEAEAAIANGIRIYAGSPDRQTTDKEAAYMAAKLDAAEAMPATEYELADRIARLDSGFTPLDQPIVLPSGYDIHNEFAVTHEPTGQLTQIGTNDGQPVYTLRVDRENYANEAGEAKFRKRPDGTQLMLVVANMLEVNGDTVSSVGLVTSNTYASRAIDAVRAGLANGRNFTVGMYGRQTLAEVKGEPVTQPTEVNQLPGELYVIAEKLQQLQADLQREN